MIWNGNTYNQSGVYNTVLQSINGCDSIVTLNLTINESKSNTQNISICHGESYIIGNSSYIINGIYKDTFQIVSGCDSIITTSLTVYDDIIANILNLNDTLSVDLLTGGNISDATFQWLNCSDNSLLLGETNSTFVPISYGSYSVIISINDCSDTTICYSLNALNTFYWSQT